MIKYHGSFNRITGPSEIPKGEDFDPFRVPNPINSKNEFGELIYPTIRDEIGDTSLVLIVSPDGIIKIIGNGVLVFPPMNGDKMYELDHIVYSENLIDEYLGKHFNPDTGELTDMG